MPGKTLPLIFVLFIFTIPAAAQDSVGAKGQLKAVSDRAESQPQTTGTGPQTHSEIQLHRRDLPDKPVPIATLGQTWHAGETLPEIPLNLVLVARRVDGERVWRAEQVGTCFECGEPMTFREAALDWKMLSLQAARVGMFVADVEITHRSACFRAGTCREANPILGQTRAQAYGVQAGIMAGTWLVTSWLRKGNKEYRIGGIKYWWVIPVGHMAMNAGGVAANLARR